MDNINKLLLPATVLIGCVILGGFYYLSQVSKQNSIEKQQKVELQAKADAEQEIKDKESSERLGKMFCVDEAQQNAIDLNKDACKRGEYCLKGDGMYLVGQYENAYKTCLQRKGLD